MVAFIIQTALTAAFLIIYICFSIAKVPLWRKWTRRGSVQANQIAPSLWRKAVDDCLEVFWSTCYVFALTLVIGTLCFNVVYHSPGHVYSGYFGYIGAMLSVSVLVCLWPWFPGRYQYPLLTFSGVLVLLGLVTGVSITFIKEVNSGDKTVFEKLCLETRFDTSRITEDWNLPQAYYRPKSITYLQNFVKYTPYGTLALIVIWGGVLAFMHFRKNKIKKGKLYKWVTGILGGLLVLGSFALACCSLGFFVYLRNEVQRLAGDTYADNEWGFGQFVSIIAWFPLVAQIFMIFFREFCQPSSHQAHLTP